MFEFRIITCADGTQVIDTSLKTPYDSLTPLQMVEYAEMDIQIDVMDRMERKRRMKEQHRKKMSKNLLYKIACLCRLA